MPALVTPPADLGLEPLNFRRLLPGKAPCPGRGGLDLNFRDRWPGNLPKWSLTSRGDTRCQGFTEPGDGIT